MLRAALSPPYMLLTVFFLCPIFITESKEPSPPFRLTLLRICLYQDSLGVHEERYRHEGSRSVRSTIGKLMGFLTALSHPVKNIRRKWIRPDLIMRI